MIPEQRREAILEMARQNSELKVESIASQFGVSRETVRRDLAQLDARGLLRRVHGGAQPPQTGAEAPFHKRLIDNADAKERIGQAAARLFRDGDTLMIDTGSTTQALAAELADRQLMIITNSVEVARAAHRPGSLAGFTWSAANIAVKPARCLDPLRSTRSADTGPTTRF